MASNDWTGDSQHQTTSEYPQSEGKRKALHSSDDLTLRHLPRGTKVRKRLQDNREELATQVSNKSMEFKSNPAEAGYVDERVPDQQTPIDPGNGASVGPVGSSEGDIYSLQQDSYPEIPRALPHEKVFSIQIGSELFKLSGASISSDAPSYFSQFFNCELRRAGDASNMRTLYIDRDPITFRDISRHLQGYHIQPRDGSHFVKLFADAQFYSLPRLISQLFESDIFIQIGDTNFQVPRDIFSGPGNSPNFFTLGFGAFFSTPSQVFPGLKRERLLRPPSVTPPSVPNRSPQVFSEIIHLLRGYPLRIRNQEHRLELLRDCRYFNLRGLEQKLIPHSICFNALRKRTEITIRLEDIRPSGIVISPTLSVADSGMFAGLLLYSRPFVDEHSHELIIDIGDSQTTVDPRTMFAEFHGDDKTRLSSLLKVVANKLNVPYDSPPSITGIEPGSLGQSISQLESLTEGKIRIRIDSDTYVTLDGQYYPSVDIIHRPGEGCRHRKDVTFESQSESQSEAQLPEELTANYREDETGPGGRFDENDRVSVGMEGAPFFGGDIPPSGSSLGVASQGSPQAGVSSQWIVSKGQWRLWVQPTIELLQVRLEVALIAVRIDALSGEKLWNGRRSFLS